MCRKTYREIILTHIAQAHEEAKMRPFQKLHLRVGLYGEEFQPRLKFQLIKPGLDFILHIKWQQWNKNRIAIIWKSFITVNRAEISPKVWTTRDEVFISFKRVIIDCASGLKLEKQTDECLGEKKFKLDSNVMMK